MGREKELSVNVSTLVQAEEALKRLDSLESNAQVRVSLMTSPTSLLLEILQQTRYILLYYYYYYFQNPTFEVYFLIIQTSFYLFYIFITKKAHHLFVLCQYLQIFCLSVIHLDTPTCFLLMSSCVQKLIYSKWKRK